MQSEKPLREFTEHWHLNSLENVKNEASNLSLLFPHLTTWHLSSPLGR